MLTQHWESSVNRMWTSRIALIFLTGVGSIQMFGDLAQLPLVKGFGAAISASPAPKVFTAHKGFETYSSRFYLRWTAKNGAHHQLELTPEIYRGVRGPYNRRNAYGAALSYAPVLNSNPQTQPMLNAAIDHVFCGESSLLDEIGVPKEQTTGVFEFELRPQQKLPPDHPWKLNYKINCNV